MQSKNLLKKKLGKSREEECGCGVVGLEGSDDTKVHRSCRILRGQGTNEGHLPSMIHSLAAARVMKSGEPGIYES